MSSLSPLLPRDLRVGSRLSAQVPDLPGCMAHGDTEAEAIEEARHAIRLYLDVLAESGGAIPEPRAYHLSPA